MNLNRLSEGTVRLLLVLVCLLSIDVAALVLCLAGDLPDEIAMTSIAGTVGTVLGAVLNAQGAKQAADTVKRDTRL